MKEITIKNTADINNTINNCNYWAKTAQESFSRAIKAASEDRDYILYSIKRCYESLQDAQHTNEECNSEIFKIDYALSIMEIWLGRYFDIREVEEPKPVEE
jgi:hypothetical protein